MPKGGLLWGFWPLERAISLGVLPPYHPPPRSCVLGPPRGLLGAVGRSIVVNFTLGVLAGAFIALVYLTCLILEQEGE